MFAHSPADRRRFLQLSSLGAAAWLVPGAFADGLARTPSQTEGPFYPDKLPLDTDNDLIRLNDDLTPAVGEVTHLTGKILSAAGEPVRNAVVEIWQADANGNYLHTRGGDAERRDAHFQGYGRFLTGLNGEYYFRTIKPVPYGPRTPHIHVAVTRGDERVLTTQCYIAGHPLNARDGVMRSTPDPAERKRLVVDFVPLEGGAAGELRANFDVVLGATPADTP